MVVEWWSSGKGKFDKRMCITVGRFCGHLLLSCDRSRTGWMVKVNARHSVWWMGRKLATLVWFASARALWGRWEHPTRSTSREVYFPWNSLWWGFYVFDHENNLFLKFNFYFVLTVSKIPCERDFHPSIVSGKGLLIFLGRSQLAGRTLYTSSNNYLLPTTPYYKQNM